LADLFLVPSEPVHQAHTDLRPPDLRPPDWLEREQALDIQHSWIVEAPAGSGKTGLLIQRFLKLLADDSVTEPEQVMALTFTVKATAELRDRVLTQLDAAAKQTVPGNDFDEQTRTLAAAVLARDRSFGWGLLARPQRLRIRTIDSVCAEIARSLPLLSGSGGQLAPMLDAAPLYQEAARRTLMLLGGEDAELNHALRTILLHRDGNLGECERLLAEMLKSRDQWGELIPLSGAALSDEALDTTVLPRLERALDQAICAGLQQLAKTIPADVLEELASLAGEMGHAAGYKGAPSPIALCANLNTAPGETAEHLAHWRALVHLLTTSSVQWRSDKGVHGNHLKFDLDKTLHQPRLRAVLDQLRHRDDILDTIKRMSYLPPATYPQEQWVVAKALFRILSRSLVELQFVFAERGACDFSELGLLARIALRKDAHGDDLAAALGMRLQHLLVDEMQDTSTSQYELIELLTEGWDGYSQTVFLVGDPKQSIYLFRQARVERFVRTMHAERLADLPVGRLQLTANFRSQRDLVEQVNEDFAHLFSSEIPTAIPSEIASTHSEDVPFVAAVPVRNATLADGMVWHARVLPYGLPAPEAAKARYQQARDNAGKIRQIAERWRARPLPAGRTRPWTIAVLVRSRNHLTEIVAALKHDVRDGPIPFRAIDIDVLGERQEVLDLFALTRALLHPADRVAWFAILHAPWCGLNLVDLHMLAGADDPDWNETTVEELIARRGDLLSPDGCQRLERTWNVMQAAARQRSRLTTAQWVERSWRSLGGDVYLGPGERANANRYLRLLDELEVEGGTIRIDRLGKHLEKLYAEAAVSPGAVDLMTIHGAKGLEWDVVIVAALERKGQSSRGRLLTWLELDSADPVSAHVVLAPIAGKGEASKDLNAWLHSIENAREAAERKRLYYVACTRAREELHLFASPVAAKTEKTRTGEIAVPYDDSLLKAAWPAAERHFTAAVALPTLLTMASRSSREQEHDQEPAHLFDIAASQSNDLEPKTMLWRLPAECNVAARFTALKPLFHDAAKPEADATEPDAGAAHLIRPEGSFAARAFGNAVHGFIELLAQRSAAGATASALLAELPQWMPRIAGVLRSEGLPPAMVERLAQRVRAALQNTLTDATGAWVIAAHQDAASERALTSWQEKRTSIRLDRIFRAGPEPLAAGLDYFWIVDFKTATHGAGGIQQFLESEKEKYAPQLENYARVLSAGGVRASQIRVMLYYPLAPDNTWWIPFDASASPATLKH